MPRPLRVLAAIVALATPFTFVGAGTLTPPIRPLHWQPPDRNKVPHFGFTVATGGSRLSLRIPEADRWPASTASQGVADESPETAPTGSAPASDVLAPSVPTLPAMTSPAVAPTIPVPPPPPPKEPVTGVSGLAQLALINRDRAAAGLPALQSRDCLMGIAQQQADAMARAGHIFHGDGVTRALRCGLSARSAENVGYTSGGVNDEMLNRLFMESPGHRANILGDFHFVGVAWSCAPGDCYIAVEFS